MVSVTGRIALRRRLRSLRTQMPYVPRTLRLVWAASSNWTLAWACLLAVLGVLPAVSVYLTKLLVDNVAAIVTTGAAGDLGRTIRLVALVAGLMVLGEILRSVADYARQVQSELIHDH